MHRPEINLFEHPTTTVYIDDSSAFLYSITLAVDHHPHRSFSDPLAGLDYIEHFAHTYEQGHSPQSTNLENRPANKLGHNFSYLAQSKLQNSVRFAEPSVVVVDYSMPQLNGLDLCSRITNPYIKKVLLTGVADEKIAIKALNTQAIDFYLNKSESSLSQELFRIIDHLRDRYFQDIYGWTKDGRIKESVPFLFNSEFADFFEFVCESLSIVEHYPIEEPWGFLLLSKDGEQFHFSISCESSRPILLGKDIDSTVKNIDPATIDLGNGIGPIYCAVYPYGNIVRPEAAKSFAQYLQGLGSLLIPQKQERHEH